MTSLLRELTTTIYLVRHAHADWHRDDARPLSASGLEAAQAVATLLEGFPITAVYSSDMRRSVETVTPLADRLGLRPRLVPDLRERELPVVPTKEFDSVVAASWRSPESGAAGGEWNVMAQARGLATMRSIVRRHTGQHVVVSTHGNMLALILNGMDPAFGYEFWRRLSFPDVYRLEFDGTTLIRVQRIWQPAG